MAMSADGNYIVVGDSDGSTDGKVYLFNTSNSMPIWMYNASEPVTSVAISANGSTIVVGTSSGLVYLFNESSSQPVWSYDVGMNALVSISADGFYFVAGNQYDVVHYDEDDIFIFNRTGTTPMWTYKFWYSGGSWVSHIFHDVAISADGNYVTYSADCYLDTFEYQFVFLFDIQGNEIFNTEAAGGEDDPCPIAITDDGSFVTTASYRVNVFDDTPGDFFTKIDLLDYYLGTGSRVNDIAIAANGSYIVAGHGNSRIYLFNNSDSTLLWNYTAGGAVTSVDIAAECLYFVAGSTDDRLYLFQYPNSTPSWNYSMGADVKFVAISANGSHCAAVTGNKIALFNTEPPPIDGEPPQIVHFANATDLNCTVLEYYHTGLNISVLATDNSMVSQVFLCENSSGSFLNRSMQNFIGSTYWIVLDIGVLNFGEALAYLFYANDTSNNWVQKDNLSNFYILNVHDFVIPGACGLNVTITYTPQFILEDTIFTIWGGSDYGGSGINHHEYKLDLGVWVTANNFTLAGISNGLHTIFYRAVDNAGNNGTVQNISIYLLANNGDYDNDELTNYAEINVYGTSIFNPDTDGDGLLDGDEVNQYGTQPTDRDTDNDGISDGTEVAIGGDPSDPNNPLIGFILLALGICGLVVEGIVLVKINRSDKEAPRLSKKKRSEKKYK